MAKSTTPTTAIKSQLEVMSGNVKSIAPQSALARFIFGDLKGGEHKHNYAMSVIRSAIEQAYKGNTRDIPEAVALCEGKSIKAKAYHAGFHAIADMVTSVKYTGKLDSKDNAEVRALISTNTDSAFAAFERDYLAVFADAKAEAKAKKEAKAASAGAPATPVESGETVAADVMVADADVVDLASAVDAIVRAIDSGLLDAREMDLLRASLALRAHAEATAQPELLVA